MPRNRLYPHLLPHDIQVWERFLQQHRADYTHFDYDVRVGQGRDPGPSISAKYRQLGIELSQRRIDAIGHTATHLDIIEITTRAGIHAIGQLVTYPTLYLESYHPTLPLRQCLVCSELAPDVDSTLAKLGIHLYIFPDKV